MAGMTTIIECAQCGQKNRVPVSVADGHQFEEVTLAACRKCKRRFTGREVMRNVVKDQQNMKEKT